MSEDSSVFPQTPFSSSPPTTFFNQPAAYSGTGHQQTDLLPAVATPHSSRNYYAHVMDQSPPSPSSPWHAGTYAPGHPSSSPTESCLGQPYSPHVRHAPVHTSSSPEESAWEMRGMDVPRNRGDATGWPPDSQAVLGQPLASLGLRSETPGLASTRAAASSWSWDGHGSAVGFSTSSHREHSHRAAAHRSSFSAHQIYGDHHP